MQAFLRKMVETSKSSLKLLAELLVECWLEATTLASLRSGKLTFVASSLDDLAPTSTLLNTSFFSLSLAPSPRFRMDDAGPSSRVRSSFQQTPRYTTRDLDDEEDQEEPSSSSDVPAGVVKPEGKGRPDSL